MRNRNGFRWWGSRPSHPLLALLIAAVAAVSAIAQTGLLLDAAAADHGAKATAVLAASGTASLPAELPRTAAAAPSDTPLPERASPN